MTLMEQEPGLIWTVSPVTESEIAAFKADVISPPPHETFLVVALALIEDTVATIIAVKADTRMYPPLPNAFTPLSCCDQQTCRASVHITSIIVRVHILFPTIRIFFRVARMVHR
jgi:hypothetical protein